jgi:hypothetical protein
VTDEAQSPPAVRAQLLATEHWSLLASRSTTQGEVLTRISMFLTVVSAALVSLALLGQATRFDGSFSAYSIGVLAFVCLVGVLTEIRVLSVGLEDAMYVLAMNRLRGAYLDLDPGMAPYLMASPYDDRAGMERTYFFLGRRTSLKQVGGSSMMFITALTSALLGLLGAAIAGAAGAGTGLAVGAGIVAGSLALAFSLILGGLPFFRLWTRYRPLSPTPPDRGRPPGIPT